MIYLRQKGNKMITNYFDDLWKKAEKKGISRYQIGCALFGKEHYNQIYQQGRVSKYMQNRYQEIDAVIDRLAKERKKK